MFKKLNLFLILFVNFIFLADSKPSVESCTPIPGWTIFHNPGSTFSFRNPSDNPASDMLVSDEVALSATNNLATKTCCDFRNKCGFDMLYIKNDGKPDFCYLSDYTCNNMDQNDVFISRTTHTKTSFSRKSKPYCENFFEGYIEYNDDTCERTQGCFENSKGSTELLPCLDNLLSKSMEHKGFFSEKMLPYKAFNLELRTDGVNKIFKLNQDGTISVSVSN